MTIKYGSVCSGIEAATVAWHRLGWKAAWYSEIEPCPSAVLQHHYPDTANVGDMNNIISMLQIGLIEAPDILCGGTPCQAFSVAGLRQSLDDARGNLSLTFCEIANVIDNTRVVAGQPESIIFWENVPGVLSTKDNAFGCFLAGLSGEDDPLVPSGKKWTNAGCVYGPKRTVAWRVLDAQYFGVAQRRRRVFVVASARKGFDPTAVLFEREGLRRDTPPRRETRKDVASATTEGAGVGINFYGGNKRVDRPEGGFYVKQEETSKTLDSATGLNPTCSQGGTAVLTQGWPAQVAPTLDAHYGDKMGLENQHINGGDCSSVARCLITKNRLDFETENFVVVK